MPDLPEYSYKSRRRETVVDPAMRRIAIGAGVVSVLVIAVALLWSGVRPRLGFGPPPEIAAPATPLRVAPADPGGLTVPEANVPIMSGDNLDTAPQLAPVAAAPAVNQLNQSAGIAALAAPVPAQVAAPAGPAEVQLAATPDEKGVQSAWARLRVKYPELQGKQPDYVPAVVAGQSIFRLRVGFDNAADAQAFCGGLVAKGAVCAVVAP